MDVLEGVVLCHTKEIAILKFQVQNSPSCYVFWMCSFWVGE